MNRKVTLKEIAGTKIIYAILLVCYYWMWARRDWQDCYDVIQNTVVVFTVVFFLLQAGRIRRYSKEEKDELAVVNLRRADAIALKLLIAAVVGIAFACAVEAVSGRTAGYALVGAVLVLAVIRFILFCVMDSRGV